MEFGRPGGDIREKRSERWKMEGGLHIRGCHRYEAYGYQGETLPVLFFPLVLAFGQVLGKFHIYNSWFLLSQRLPSVSDKNQPFFGHPTFFPEIFGRNGRNQRSHPINITTPDFYHSFPFLSFERG